MADALSQTRLVLRLEYDGTDFHGFAESRGVRTVAGELRRIVEQVTQQACEIRGASRTDTGVHALDQCVLVTANGRLDTTELLRAISSMLPPDLRVVRSDVATEEFHPSVDAMRKLYVYRIWNGRAQSVHRRRYEWRVDAPLDIKAMSEAAKVLVGTHDFAAFRTRSKGQTENSVRTIESVRFDVDFPAIQFQVIGDGFLYRMVRNLVGTLVELGRGAIPPQSMAEILKSCDRTRSGPSAPPHGLFLAQLQYPGEPQIEMRKSLLVC